MDLGGLMLDDFLAGAILVGDLVEPILLASVCWFDQVEVVKGGGSSVVGLDQN